MKKRKRILNLCLILSTLSLFGCENEKLKETLALPFQENTVLISRSGITIDHGAATFNDLVKDGMKSKGLKSRNYDPRSQYVLPRINDKIFILYVQEYKNNWLGFLDLDERRPLYQPYFQIQGMEYLCSRSTDEYSFFFFDQAVYAFDSELNYQRLDINPDDCKKIEHYPGGLVLMDENNMVYQIDNTLTKEVLFQGTPDTTFDKIIHDTLIFHEDDDDSYSGYDLSSKQMLDQESLEAIQKTDDTLPFRYGYEYLSNLKDKDTGEVIFDFDSFLKTDPSAIYVQETLDTTLDQYSFLNIRDRNYLQVTNTKTSWSGILDAIPLIYEIDITTFETSYIGCLDRNWTGLRDIYRQNI